jgi:hypothetical protein
VLVVTAVTGAVAITITTAITVGAAGIVAYRFV